MGRVTHVKVAYYHIVPLVLHAAIAKKSPYWSLEQMSVAVPIEGGPEQRRQMPARQGKALRHRPTDDCG